MEDIMQILFHIKYPSFTNSISTDYVVIKTSLVKHCYISIILFVIIAYRRAHKKLPNTRKRGNFIGVGAYSKYVLDEIWIDKLSAYQLWNFPQLDNAMSYESSDAAKMLIIYS